MTREEYFRMREALAHVEEALRHGHLAPEERASLAALAETLSRRLATPWIPMDWTRRTIALVLLGSGLVGAVAGLELLLWGLPLVAVLSPRIMGENPGMPLRRHSRLMV